MNLEKKKSKTKLAPCPVKSIKKKVTCVYSIYLPKCYRLKFRGHIFCFSSFFIFFFLIKHFAMSDLRLNMCHIWSCVRARLIKLFNLFHRHYNICWGSYVTVKKFPENISFLQKKQLIFQNQLLLGQVLLIKVSLVSSS